MPSFPRKLCLRLRYPKANALTFGSVVIRKEAVLSSQIEGTQSSLSDLLLFEHDVVPGVPEEDVRETTNYLAALNLGLRSMEEGLPLSLRLLKQVHGELLRGRWSCGSPKP